MLFDLEPYLPFHIFATLWVVFMGALAIYGERQDNNRNR